MSKTLFLYQNHFLAKDYCEGAVEKTPGAVFHRAERKVVFPDGHEHYAGVLQDKSDIQRYRGGNFSSVWYCDIPKELVDVAIHYIRGEAHSSL